MREIKEEKKEMDDYVKEFKKEKKKCDDRIHDAMERILPILKKLDSDNEAGAVLHGLLASVNMKRHMNNIMQDLVDKAGEEKK